GAAAQADAVDIGGQHVAGGEDVVVVQVVELVEVGGEQAGDVQDQHDDDGRHDGRDGDLGQKLPAVGPIHPGRLVQRGVDRRHGGQIHDGPVACVLDQSRNDHDPPEQVRPGHEVDGLKPHGCDDLIDNASHISAGGGVLQKYLHQAGHDHPGQEI